MKRLFFAAAALLANLHILANPVEAQLRRWVGGNGVWTDGFALNWSPQDEPDFDDTAYFSAPDQVRLGSNNSIDALTLLSGAHLTTEEYLLDVYSDVALLGRLTVGGNALSTAPSTGLRAGSIATVPGAQLNLGGTTLEYNVPSADGATGVISNQGTLAGNGVISNLDVTDAIFTMFINGGTLDVKPVYRPGVFVPIGSVNPELTLQIRSHSPNARIDLDGSDGGTRVGAVNIWRNQTLDVDVRLLDAMSGDLSMVHNSTIDVAHAWELDSGALTVDNGYIPFGLFVPAVPADTSYIRGGQLTQTGGLIEVVDHDGTLQFDAGFELREGQFINHGTVISNVRFDLEDDARFTGGGTLINGRDSDWASLNIQRLAVVEADVVNHGVMDINGFGRGLGRRSWATSRSLARGRLNVDLAGTGVRQQDSLLVGGNVQIDGELHLYRTSGFAPGLGDIFYDSERIESVGRV